MSVVATLAGWRTVSTMSDELRPVDSREAADHRGDLFSFKGY